MMALALLAFTAAFATLALVFWLAERWGFLDDPWPDTPGARTDRRRLLDEGRAE
jgi:hypothetical protein